MKKKKRNTSTILLAVVFLAGLSLMLYPVVSNYLNTRVQSGVVSGYQQYVQESNTEEHIRMISHARQFNESLLERSNPFTLTEDQQQRYNALLNLSGNGMMGYVEIPCIDVRLPIYHGTEEDVLQQAVGHIEWTSLPVGGESSHCVISGHRGLPTADLLTHIDRMRLGDRFYIHVLGQELEYRVDQIEVVLPSDTSLLTIEEGKDYVTLLTCTPYGINSHRLLVRGSRVLDGQGTGATLILTDEIEEVSLVYVIPVVLVAVVILVLACMGIANVVEKKTRKEKRCEQDETTSA